MTHFSHSTAQVCFPYPCFVGIIHADLGKSGAAIDSCPPIFLVRIQLT